MTEVDKIVVDIRERIADLMKEIGKIESEIGKVIVGQKSVVKECMLCLLTDSHALLEGLPGLAKTLLIKTLSDVFNLEFRRIQFTPDLMPSDITGTYIIDYDDETGKKVFKFHKGPIFSNIILADEINRASPRTQAALLEAMQERTISTGEKSFNLDRPFFVLATQNPIEQQGTYPLPEAQLDRFMFKIIVNYPTYEEELEIVSKMATQDDVKINKIIDKNFLVGLQKFIKQLAVPEPIRKYAVTLVSKTRPGYEDSSEFVKKYVEWGAGPRASQFLIAAGKANAFLNGRLNVSARDINFVARPILRHRIIPNYRADAESINTENIITNVIEEMQKEKTT